MTFEIFHVANARSGRLLHGRIICEDGTSYLYTGRVPVAFDKFALCVLSGRPAFGCG
jgi:hypothetical protein